MAYLFEDSTQRDKDQLREIRELDRMYEGRALTPPPAPGRWWHVPILLFVFAVAAAVCALVAA